MTILITLYMGDIEYNDITYNWFLQINDVNYNSK